MKKSIAIIGGVLTLLCTGCTFNARYAAVKDALKSGRVTGLSSTNSFCDTTFWSIPTVTLGPYSQVRGVASSEIDSSGGKLQYVFFLGERQTTQKWEVFACMVLRGNHWETVPVTLPPLTTGK